MPQSKFKIEKKKDVAKTTILVLLILTILLSVISTWYVLDMINSVKQEYTASMQSNLAQGQINVGGLPSPAATKGNIIETGKVSVAIKNPK